MTTRITWDQAERAEFTIKPNEDGGWDVLRDGSWEQSADTRAAAAKLARRYQTESDAEADAEDVDAETDAIKAAVIDRLEGLSIEELRGLAAYLGF